MNIERFKNLVETSKDKRTDARKMGTTYQTLLNVINGADLRVSTLESIAKFYNVPIGYFFDEAEADGKSAHVAEIENLKGQIKGLKDALKLLGVKLKAADNKQDKKGR